MSQPEILPSRASTSSNDMATTESTDPSIKLAERRPRLRRAIATLDIIHPAHAAAESSRPTSPMLNSEEDMATPSTTKHHSLHKMSDIHVGQWIKDHWTHTTPEERKAKAWANATREKQAAGQDSHAQDIYIDPAARYNAYANEIGVAGVYPGYQSVPGFLFGGLLLTGLW